MNTPKAFQCPQIEVSKIHPTLSLPIRPETSKSVKSHFSKNLRHILQKGGGHYVIPDKSQRLLFEILKNAETILYHVFKSISSRGAFKHLAFKQEIAAEIEQQLKPQNMVLLSIVAYSSTLFITFRFSFRGLRFWNGLEWSYQNVHTACRRFPFTFFTIITCSKKLLLLSGTLDGRERTVRRIQLGTITFDTWLRG